jgi:catechol 2,3-dioxygenase-like lactoylglutathione lyase family enzyme
VNQTAPAATLSLSRIRQIAQVVHDVPAAVAFYRDKLGMKLLFEIPPQMAFFDCNGTWLMLSLPEKEFDHPGSCLYFEVADIQAAYETLKERGVEFIDAPHRLADMGTHELWMTFFRDLDRNPIALRAEVKK